MVFFTESGIKTEAEDEFDQEFDQDQEEQNQPEEISEPEEFTASANDELDAEPSDDEDLFESDIEIEKTEKEWTKLELLDKLIELSKPNSDLYIDLMEIKNKYNLDENRNLEEQDEDSVLEDNLPESIVESFIDILKRM